MSVFESEIIKAKKLSRQRLLWFTLVLASLFLLVAGVVLATRSYTVNIMPEDAAATATITSSSGLSIIFESRVFPLSSSNEVLVQAFGYNHEIVSFKHSTLSRYIDLNMTLAPMQLSLLPTEKLHEPYWSVDGQFVSSELNLSLALLPGEYHILLQSGFHDEAHLQVIHQKGKNFVGELEVKRSSGKYDIASEPSSATININGEVVGETPVEGLLVAGEHKITASYEGYETIEETFTITTSSSQFERNYALRPALGTLQATLDPPGGRLYVNGKPQKITGYVQVNKMGMTKVDYTKPGYQTISKSITAASDPIHINLQPLYGRLEISSHPPARVFIDDIEAGQTPVNKKLLAVSHKVELRQEGYISKHIRVDIENNRLSRLDERLISEQDAVLSQSKKKYSNKVGIKFTRFMPEDFTMGAPRSQKGQRANEILRKVNFSRHLYFSDHEISSAIYSKYKNVNVRDNKPVTGISWADAVLFCNWLSEQEQLQKVYVVRNGHPVSANMDAIGYRLPTEAEWEWVARYANKNSPSIFVWGDAYKLPAKIGNLADVSATGTVKVFIPLYDDGFKGIASAGSFPAEPSGLFDLAGNVSEWVHDSYTLNPPDPSETFFDYAGPPMTKAHVVKGSNYMSASWTELRASFRESLESQRDDVGFRVARYVY